MVIKKNKINEAINSLIYLILVLKLYLKSIPAWTKIQPIKTTHNSQERKSSSTLTVLTT